MKKSLLLLSLLLCSSFVFSQLTMQSFTPPTGGQPFAGVWNLQPSGGDFTPDPGTTVYYRYESVGGNGITRDLYIIRQNNIWKILEKQGGTWVGGIYYIDRYHAKTFSSDNNPPCNDT